MYFPRNHLLLKRIEDLRDGQEKKQRIELQMSHCFIPPALWIGGERDMESLCVLSQQRSGKVEVQSGGASVIAAMRPSSVAKALLPGKSRAVVVSNGK